MDFQEILNQITQSIGAYVPNLIGALLFLIVGWFVALVASAVVRGILSRTTLDNRIAKWIAGGERAKTMDVERTAGKAVYYIIMLFVLVGFFQSLQLTIITQPINNLLNQVFGFIPQLIGAGILILVAWIVASVVRLVVTKALEAARIDERLGDSSEGEEKEGKPLAKTLGDAMYWLIFLLFLPAILGALELAGLLQPVQVMLDKLLGFLPNLLAAAVILLVGWFVARLVQRIVTNLLAAVGTDSLSQRIGLGEQKLSALLGWVVYIFILIPVAIAALNALALDAITAPASAMLNMLLGAIPSIFAAVVVLGLSYLIGRLVSGLVTNVLTGIGFNSLFAWLGIGSEPSEDQLTPSQIAGTIVLTLIMLFAVMEASSLLGFALLGELASQFMVFASHVLFGLVILAIGIYVANFVGKLVHSSGVAQPNILSMIAKAAILLLAGAMALRQMGLANEIISLAFGLLLGAVAIAAAIAFGIGGRDIAARQLDEWSDSIKSKKS